ncbi:MAG: GTPase Era [Bacillota bacterium]|jgi:GTP-binding protein Era|nr:GTPase Era [Thermoanaerobacteraceae bacterium]
MTEKEHRSGFVSIVGRPNVGKSTLLNRLVGRKVAIVSDRPQTTRHRILSVLTLPEAQIVFLDTPGIHKPRHQLGEYMVKVALGTLREVDLILFLVEAHAAFGAGDGFILERIKEAGTPAILCINKADLVPRKSLLPLIDDLQHKHDFRAIVPVSALTGENTDRLVEAVVAELPPGPRYYPAETVTDQPEQLVIAELIREKILQLTREEVPHGVAVVVEEMVPRPRDLLYIRAVVYTERESHKGILVGQGGQMLKKIGRLAREEIEALFGSRVYLDLWVKVRPHWRREEAFLRRFGYLPE